MSGRKVSLWQKASMPGLILLFTKKGIEEVGEGVGKRMLLDLGQKYVDEGILAREVFERFRVLDEQELAVALKSALKGKIDASQLAFLSKLDPDALRIVNTWEPEIFLRLEDDLSQDAIFAQKFFESAAKNEELVNSWKVLYDAGKTAAKSDIPTLKFFNKVDELGEGVLKTKLLSKLDDVELVRFSDEFADATGDVLKAINGDDDLIGLWKKYSREFKGTKYITDRGAFKTCQNVLDDHPDDYLGNLVKQVMEAPKPTNSEQVLVGVTHPSFNGKVFMGRNFKSSEGALEAAFKTETAHPLIRERIKYMDFVRNSVTDGTGKVVNEALANKLLDIDNLNKLTTAGRAGYHGEVRALSDALYELEKTRSVTSSTLSEFDLFIRNSSDKVVQRCPCCFHITQGVKVLGGN